nr:reverse transcriptase domain-containing protein [Tanacetum cinerariifolium]
MTITRSGMTSEAIEELIAQQVVKALAAYEANHVVGLVVESQSKNGDNGDNGSGRGNGNGNRGGNGNGNPNRNDRSAMHIAQSTMLCTKVVPKEEDRVEKFIRGLPNNIQGNVIAAEPMRLQNAIWIANNLMDQKLKGYVARSVENNKGLITTIRTTVYNNPFIRDKILVDRMWQEPTRLYTVRCSNYKKVVHMARDCKAAITNYSRSPRAKSEGWSFVSSTFSALLDVIPSTLDVRYDVELADGRVVETILYLEVVLTEQGVKRIIPENSETRPQKRSDSQKKPYPASMPEQTLASVAPRIAHHEKESSDKLKHGTNCEDKRKCKKAKEFEQTRRVQHKTIIRMVRGKNKKRPHEQSEQWTYNEILFPSMQGCQLVDSPIILETLIKGFQVYRIYVDMGSSFEVMYEHCFRNLGTENKAKLKEPNTPLVGFSNKVSYPIGTIDLNVTMGEPGKLWTVMMKFMVVKSHSPYNVILG